MPPTTKPQTKKKEAEEGKEKKAVKAVVAALLLFVALAAFVHAQTATATNTPARGNATQVVKNIEDWAVGGAGLMVTLFGAMFWAAVGIILFHLAVSYIAPTRFQRLSSMWDAVERAKDVAIVFAVLFGIFYGIMAAAAAISGQFTVERAWDLFVRIVTKPLVDLYSKAFPQQAGTPPPGGP
jgi:hypothetical protein